MAYELLLTNYLLYLGNDETEGLNIQQKLDRLNKELCFIPKQLMHSWEFIKEKNGIKSLDFSTIDKFLKSIKKTIELIKKL